nr:Trp operon repressor [Chlamydiota bacterium]
MDKENLAKEWKRFLNLCTKMDSAQQFEKLFTLFLTPAERDDLALRLALVKELLKEEKTQREIAADLGVSIAKITRGANMLKTTPP